MDFAPGPPAPPRPAAPPGAVRALRVLLWLVAGVTAVMVVAGILLTGADAEQLGRLTWFAVPGALAGWSAARLHRPGRGRWGCALAAAVILLLRALGALGQGEPTGVTGLLAPVVLLVLLTRPSVRGYLRR